MNKTSLALQPGGCSGLIPHGCRGNSLQAGSGDLEREELLQELRMPSVIAGIPWLYSSLGLGWSWGKDLKGSSLRAPSAGDAPRATN